MRHFLSLPCAPDALAGGVLAGPAIAMLVTLTGATHRLASAHLGARPRAVQVAVITMSADLYLAMTAFARIQPMGLWTLRHAPSTRDWTTPCDTRIKAARMRLFRRRRVEGPGFWSGMCPGLRLFGVRTQDSGDGDGNPGQRAERLPHLRSSTCARPTRRPLSVNLSGRISFIKACRSYESRKERFWKQLRSNPKTPESGAFAPPFTAAREARKSRSLRRVIRTTRVVHGGLWYPGFD